MEATFAIPPIRAGNILPVIVMLMVWIGLRSAQVSEATSFVLAVVVAQAYLVWRNLPQAAQSLSEVRAVRPALLRWPVIAVLALTALQIWLNDPLVTQRLITAFAAFLLSVMVLGGMRKKAVMERLAPRHADGSQKYELVSLFRINALVAAVVICVNEALIASETLVAWITVIPFFVLVLHAIYWLGVLMVLPPERAQT